MPRGSNLVVVPLTLWHTSRGFIIPVESIGINDFFLCEVCAAKGVRSIIGLAEEGEKEIL